jgi:N-methylhydantoinase A
MLLADHVRDHAAGVLNRSDLEREFQRLERIARKDLRRAELIRSADIRYVGQSYELTVPWNTADPAAPFHQEHQRVYGYSNPERAIEIVTVRVRARLGTVKPALLSKRSRSRTAGKPALRRIHCGGAWRDTPAYPRSSLTTATLPAPALVLDYGSTTLIPPGWTFSVDKFGSLKIERRRDR